MLSIIYFNLVRRLFHLRVSKVEEILGSDVMESDLLELVALERDLESSRQRGHDTVKELRRKLSLISLVKEGRHQVKKRS